MLRYIRFLQRGPEFIAIIDINCAVFINMAIRNKAVFSPVFHILVSVPNKLIASSDTSTLVFFRLYVENFKFFFVPCQVLDRFHDHVLLLVSLCFLGVFEEIWAVEIVVGCICQSILELRWIVLAIGLKICHLPLLSWCLVVILLHLVLSQISDSYLQNALVWRNLLRTRHPI